VRSLSDVQAALAPLDPAATLVFNLCESLGGRAADEPKVPQLLQELGFRYTGSPPYALATCLDKARAKRILQAHGVPTAPFQVCRSDRLSALRVPFPAIVKPVAEDASLGITRDSVVTSREALRRQVAYVLGTYRQPALVEAFIPGREFNVGIWGNGTPHLLPLAELDYGEWPALSRVCHFFAKWEESAPEYTTTYVRCPAEVEPALGERIRAVALRAYTLTGCSDYARVDLRVMDGQPYVLEVNPNPCLAVDSGFANAARVAGYGHDAMLAQIVRWAWARRRRARLKRAA
jgi:D-alanine-D-alanine ligase